MYLIIFITLMSLVNLFFVGMTCLLGRVGYSTLITHNSVSLHLSGFLFMKLGIPASRVHVFRTVISSWCICPPTQYEVSICLSSNLLCLTFIPSNTRKIIPAFLRFLYHPFTLRSPVSMMVRHASWEQQID